MLFLLLVLVLIFLIIYRYTRKTTKHIYFVGPRNTGKTFVLHHLIHNEKADTVPSLEDNEVKYKNYVIHDIVERDAKTFNAVYGLDSAHKYFFFFRSNNDLIDYVKGYDVTFVYFGRSSKCDLRNEMRHKLVCLENEPERMRKYVEMV